MRAWRWPPAIPARPRPKSSNISTPSAAGPNGRPTKRWRSKWPWARHSAAAAALVTMKHVGLNVAADPFFTAAYTGVAGPLVVVSADDPGMASSQNEQDNRRYAVAAGVPMLEPADSQEAYDFTLAALELSARWHLPVMLRMTTRVCHSKTLVEPHPPRSQHGRRHISSATSRAA